MVLCMFIPCTKSSLVCQHDSLMLQVKMFTPLSDNLGLIVIFLSFSLFPDYTSAKKKKKKKHTTENRDGKMKSCSWQEEMNRGKKEEENSCLHSSPSIAFPSWEVRNSLSDCFSVVIHCCMFKLQNRAPLTLFYIPKFS